METIELTVQPRTIIGKQVKAMRRAGWVPAVLYSRHAAPKVLQANGRELSRVLQREPIKGSLLHIDFLGVSMTEKITVEVPLRVEGTSPVVAHNEGVLIHGMDAIEIECLPGDLIDSITIDVSGLTKVGDVIYVSDLKAPGTVKLLADLNATVVRVSHLAGEEVEEAPTAEVAAAEPEIIKKGKAEEEAEAE